MGSVASPQQQKTAQELQEEKDRRFQIELRKSQEQIKQREMIDRQRREQEERIRREKEAE